MSDAVSVTAQWVRDAEAKKAMREEVERFNRESASSPPDASGMRRFKFMPEQAAWLLAPGILDAKDEQT